MNDFPNTGIQIGPGYSVPFKEATLRHSPSFKLRCDQLTDTRLSETCIATMTAQRLLSGPHLWT